MADTSAKVYRICPSEIIKDSGGKPEYAGMTPLHMLVDAVGIVTFSTWFDPMLNVRVRFLPVSFRTLVLRLIQQPVRARGVIRTIVKIRMTFCIANYLALVPLKIHL
jgi:hypothetical protein